MKFLNSYKLIVLATLLAYLPARAQKDFDFAEYYSGMEKDDVDHDYTPLTLKLSPDGNKYVRFLLWNQFWLQTNNLRSDQNNLRISPVIRRARVLAFAQVSPRFLVLTHFGMNSETAVGMDPLGENNNVSLFFHDIWGEYKLHDNHFVGMGVHYWNGLSRLTNQSTLNFMTLDAPIFNWAQLGLSDQFARHLGVYAHGSIGKLHYRVSVNDALQNTLDVTRAEPSGNRAIYAGRQVAFSEGLDQNRLVTQGYFHVELGDAESTKLPYFVGTFLGTKSVFNVGGGFFHHKGGTVSGTGSDSYEYHDVIHYAFDAFYDAPVGNSGMAINALLTYYNFNFGPNYVKSAANPAGTVATGDVMYGQFGLLLPGEGPHNRFMPYVTYANGNPEAFEDNSTITKIGLNYFMNAHHSKLTLEYTSTQTPNSNGLVKASNLTLQMHVFL